MNIFVLHKNPRIAAIYHCDQHVVKMILESAQLLSTNLRLAGVNEDFIYKSTHINHPSCIWVRESKQNYLWLCELSHWLNEEFKLRFGHLKLNPDHRSYAEVTSRIYHHADLFPDIGLTEFKQAMPEDCKMDNPILAYRKYYCQEKPFARYTIRKKPLWLEMQNKQF